MLSIQRSDDLAGVEVGLRNYPSFGEAVLLLDGVGDAHQFRVVDHAA